MQALYQVITPTPKNPGNNAKMVKDKKDDNGQNVGGIFPFILIATQEKSSLV